MSATLESRPATCASRVAQLRWPSIWVATVVAVVVTAWVLFLANGTPAGAAVDDPGTFLVTVLDAVTFAGLLFVLMRAVNMAHGSLFLLAAYVAIRVREAMVEVVHRLVAEGVAVLVVEQNLRAAWRWTSGTRRPLTARASPNGTTPATPTRVLTPTRLAGSAVGEPQRKARFPAHKCRQLRKVPSCSSPMNEFNRRRLLVITEGPSSYTPTWPSVDQHPPAPGWFQADAIRAKGVKFIVTLHHMYHFSGYFDQAPQQQTARLSETHRLNFLAHYYNRVVAWNKDVVTTHKDGLNDRNSVFDYERGGPAGMRNPYWLTDDSISSSSWCYTVGIGYYSLGAMLHSLIDRVSKNGNVLLNIAPVADGTIPSGQRTILLGMGDYLKRFGESLYATRAWTAFGEGPDPDGWWLLCHAARGNQPGHPVHPQQSQHRAVCHRHGLARQHTEHHHTRLQPAGATAPTAPSASNRHGTAATTSSGASTASATGRHQIINRGTGTALDSLGNSTAGSGTAMWAPNSSPNNHWTIAPV
jgi:hypothetical protein